MTTTTEMLDKQALKAHELKLHNTFNAYMNSEPGSQEERDLELELEELTLQLFLAFASSPSSNAAVYHVGSKP